MATTCEVNVKWGKEKYTVTIDLTQPPSVFKAQLYSLTHVPIDKQKITGFKGGLLKDDGDWHKIQPRNKQQVMLIGTAESDVPTTSINRPTTLQVTFVEDLSASEQASMAVSLGRQGLKNIGNTCYMNSVLQALRAIPEFSAGATRYAGPSALVKALGKTYRDLAGGRAPVCPREFWLELCRNFPQFAELSEMGFPKQHDADECMTCLLAQAEAAGLREAELFEGRTVTRRRCLETDAEPDTFSSDTFRKLECHIDGSTTHMMPGIETTLRGQVEKHSDVLGREALYSTETKIQKLPYCLTVQFARFFWKAAIGDRAKIVRTVQFPMELDVLALCDEQLAERAKVVRAYDRAREERKAGLESLSKEAAERALAAPADVVKEAPLENQTGLYELAAVVSHIGMSADGGHYVAWVKEMDGDGNEEEEEEGGGWFRYDDEKVTKVQESEVAKVDGRGGAQWHIAYLAIYRTKPRYKN